MTGDWRAMLGLAGTMTSFPRRGRNDQINRSGPLIATESISRIYDLFLKFRARSITSISTFADLGLSRTPPRRRRAPAATGRGYARATEPLISPIYSLHHVRSRRKSGAAPQPPRAVPECGGRASGRQLLLVVWHVAAAAGDGAAGSQWWGADAAAIFSPAPLCPRHCMRCAPGAIMARAQPPTEYGQANGIRTGGWEG